MSLDLKFILKETESIKYELQAFDKDGQVCGSLKFEVVDNPYEYWNFLSEGEYENEIGLNKYILLDRIYVESVYRRHNLGTRLMNGLIKIVNLKFIDYNILLEADAFDGNISEDALIAFYQKFGFVRCGDFERVMIRITGSLNGKLSIK